MQTISPIPVRSQLNVTVLIKAPREIVEATAGFSQETVRRASAVKDEPEWMLDFRLRAWQTFESLPWPKPTDEAWRRTRLTGFKLENYTPFATNCGTVARHELDPVLRNELDEMESSASLIYRDGGLIYSEENDDLDAQGVIFTDLQTAVQRHPDLVRRYFMTEAVTPDANKFNGSARGLVGHRFVYLRAPQHESRAALASDPESGRWRRRLSPHPSGR